MKKALSLLLLIFYCLSTFAEDNSFFINELEHREWHGPNLFLKHASEEKLDVCNFLYRSYRAYSRKNVPKRRILIILRTMDCEQKEEIVLKSLESKNIPLLVDAIKTAAFLKTKEKIKIKKKILNINDNLNDLSLKNAIKYFENSI